MQMKESTDYIYKSGITNPARVLGDSCCQECYPLRRFGEMASVETWGWINNDDQRVL